IGVAERTFRDHVDEAARFGMVSNHRGAHSNPSLSAAHPPRHWHSVRRAGAIALTPPKRRSTSPPGFASGPASSDVPGANPSDSVDATRANTATRVEAES